LKQRLGIGGVALVAILSFVLGIVVQCVYDARKAPGSRQVVQTPRPPDTQPRLPESSGVNVASINFDREPLWAYGFEAPPKPGDKAQPQAPPTRNLRPNQDPVEQTKARQVHGSAALLRW
jgi:hypothetical protein